jgi:hypothetical protein
MSDLRPQPTKVTLGGKEYSLLFSMKAVVEIQDHFDSPITDLIDLLSDERNMYKNVTHVLTVLINANIARLNDNEDGEKRPYIDEDYIYRHLTTGVFKDVRNTIFLAFADTAPESDSDADPQKGGQRKCSPSPASSILARRFSGFLKKKFGI